MTYSRWNGSSWQSISTLNRWTGSVWTAIQNGYRWTGSVWQNIYSSFSISVSPSSVTGSGGPGIVTSNAATVTVSGGSGSYSYQWNKLSNGGPTITINNPTSASTTFSANLFHGGGNAVGNFDCVVTDTVTSAQLTSNTVSCALDYTGP